MSSHLVPVSRGATGHRVAGVLPEVTQPGRGRGRFRPGRRRLCSLQLPRRSSGCAVTSRARDSHHEGAQACRPEMTQQECPKSIQTSRPRRGNRQQPNCTPRGVKGRRPAGPWASPGDEPCPEGREEARGGPVVIGIPWGNSEDTEVPRAGGARGWSQEAEAEGWQAGGHPSSSLRPCFKIK